MNLFRKVYRKFKTFFRVSKEQGLRGIFVVISSKIKSHQMPPMNPYMEKNQTSPTLRKIERNTKFEHSPKISVIVPLYNTNKKFLKEMIHSVLHQTYRNFELCLFDASDAEHRYVKRICFTYRIFSRKIKYKYSKKNYGISGNTNEAIKISSGEYLSLLDHDDVLHTSALFEVVKTINEKKSDFIYTDESTFEQYKLYPVSMVFKPDYAPDTLRSYNYICHFITFSRKLLNKVGMLSDKYEGSQDYDLILRLSEKANSVSHIARILYFWRISEGSVANANYSAKPYCITSAKKALSDHLERLGLKGEVCDSPALETTYKINYEIQGEPLISIIIPNKDHVEDLNKCLKSILNKSSYKNIEILIIENNSENSDTFAYYEQISKDERIRVLKYSGEFNYSKINNFAANEAKGEYLLLLNNDTEVISECWLEEMLMFAQRKDVGAVGAKLYYPDDTIQHAGVLMGINHVAGHAHKGWKRDSLGYAGRLVIAQNMSGVTGACLMMRKKVFDEINGFDEEFPVAFNDVDLCLRIRNKGYLIVFTPYAELYHYESKSRGYEEESQEKWNVYNKAVKRLQSKWSYELEHDPYYNKNLTLQREDFSLK